MFSMIPYRRRGIGNRIDPFSDDFFRPFFMDERMNRSFKVDVSDKGDHYLLEADMPGIDRDNVHVDIDNGVMTISVELDESTEKNEKDYVYRERRIGNMSRAFNLDGIREDGITAEYVNGVLKLDLPKMEETPVPQARRLEIN